MTKPYYLNKLECELQRRMRSNPSYSMRAYARFLGIDSGALSRIIRQERSFPLKKSEAVADKLNLSPEEKDNFCKSIQFSRGKLEQLVNTDSKSAAEKLLEEERHFRVIAEWEYFAVFELLETTWTCPSDIARKLELSLKRVEYVLNDLEEMNFVKKTSHGDYVKLVDDLVTTEDVPSQALRKSHKELLAKASDKIDTVPVENRYFATSTVAINPAKLDELKTVYREFREKLCALIDEGEKSEVFQIGFHAYPLTNMNINSSGEDI